MEKGTHCAGCDKPFRGRRDKIADFPNTAQYGSNGNCTNCFKLIRAGRELPKTKVKAAVVLTEKDRINKANLDAFMEARRKREQKDQRRQKVRMVTK